MNRAASWKRFGWLLGMWFCAASRVGASLYYVNPARGNDGNSGTGENVPLKTLAQVNQLSLHAGDAVLLAAGQIFEGQLALENATGTATNPILISSYPQNTKGTDGRALIDAKGFGAGVCLKNCAFIEVANLKITANGGGTRPGQRVKPGQRFGVLIVASQPGEFAGFTLTNVAIKDVFYEAPGFIRSPVDTKTANGAQSYGWGIKFLITDPAARMRDLKVANCEIENVSHTGLQFTGPRNGLLNVEVQNVKLARTGGPGVQMSGVCGGHFSLLDVQGSGSTNDARNWKRGSGLWTWDSSNVVIEKSRFQNANGPGDSAGVHIDFNCRNVIVQKNFSANNAGGFCEILGNNYNCAYRYNVSVNDGWRIKGRDGALQEGKTFWLSGYVGDKQRQQGPFNTYFYNNTIYVRSNLEARISVSPTARGVWIANNIFYFEGGSKTVRGDQTRADSSGFPAPSDVVFGNNLFLRRDNWPADLPLHDLNPILGDPGFQNPGGLKAEDYRPANGRLVAHRGLAPAPLAHDSIGLLGGLNLERDILGQPIADTPDLGAIETTASIKLNPNSL